MSMCEYVHTSAGPQGGTRFPVTATDLTWVVGTKLQSSETTAVSLNPMPSLQSQEVLFNVLLRGREGKRGGGEEKNEIIQSTNLDNLHKLNSSIVKF